MTPSAPPSLWQRLLTADARYSRALRYAERPGLLRRVAIVLAHSGDSWLWGIGLVVAWLLGGPELKDFALRLFVSIFGLGAFVLVVKRLIRRQRPAGEWGAIYRNTDPHSFPSGHAARMALLVVLAMAWGPAWFAWLLVVWAPLVALARVAMGVHYLSDIVGGAVVGAAVAVAMVALWP